LKFTGHERDVQLNGDTLDNMHARNYNPLWGRFLSVDPGRDFTPNAPQSWNLYAYARNNPVNAIDPDGRNWAAALAGLVTQAAENTFHVFTGDEIYISLTPPPPMSLTAAGLFHIIREEGHARGGYGAYDDMLGGQRGCVVGGPGNCTIGIGHNLLTGPCTAADCAKYAGMTYDQSLALLFQDLQPHIDRVNGLLRAPVDDDKFQGLIDFDMNVRGGVLRAGFSDELTALQFGLFSGVANGMREYVKGYNNQTHRKEEMGGLVRRRGWDAAHFDRRFHAFP
jgi:RHS repeat-associated protein